MNSMAEVEGLDRRAAARELELIEAEFARRSLRAFVVKTWPLVEPSKELVWNWHLDELCTLLENVTRGRIKRLLINVPPGTMKSLLVRVFWPTWEWASDPALGYITASYDQHLSIRDNLRVRDIVTSPWYRRHFRARLSSNQNAKEMFRTISGGWMFATSVRGGGTGEHPDRGIVDDPTTAKQAKSKADREAANDWFDATMSTRGVTRDIAFVVIMQRLHQEDLSGHLLQRGGWTHVMFPMEFDPERADPRDHRRRAGELLWPQLFSEEKVARLKLDLGAYNAAGQLQQRPAPQGGGLFKRSWFKLITADAVPPGGRETRGWDTAATEGDGDYTVGVKIKRVGQNFYVRHVLRGQWGPADVDAIMKQAAVLDGRSCAIREEKEGGSAGKAVVINRASSLVGYDYQGVPVTGDKETRAKPFRTQAEAGNVYVVIGPWTEEYLQELEVFPNGANDDQVDGSSCAFNDLTTGPQPVRQVEVAWGG